MGWGAHSQSGIGLLGFWEGEEEGKEGEEENGEDGSLRWVSIKSPERRKMRRMRIVMRIFSDVGIRGRVDRREMSSSWVRV